MSATISRSPQAGHDTSTAPPPRTIRSYSLMGLCAHKWRRDHPLPLRLKLVKALWYVASVLAAPLLLVDCDEVGKGTRTRSRPIVVNNGSIAIGRDVSIVSRFVPSQLITRRDGRIQIGDHTSINFGVTIRAASRVVLGDRVRVGPYVTVADDMASSGCARAIHIGCDVWLAARVRVMPGVHIGDGTVVSAGSVVCTSLPANVVAAGNPARIIRLRNRTVPTAHDQPIAPSRARIHHTLHTVKQLGGRLAAFVALRRADVVGTGPRLHGTPHIENWGAMRIGEALAIQSMPVQSHLVTGPQGTLVVGDRVTMGTGVGIAAHQHVEIGDDVTIGDYVMILDTDFHDPNDTGRVSATAPIVIESSVRIDSHALILKGTHLPAGTHVHSGSVVRFNKTTLASVVTAKGDSGDFENA